MKTCLTIRSTRIIFIFKFHICNNTTTALPSFKVKMIGILSLDLQNKCIQE